MKILAVGGLESGFVFYGPFTDEEVADDPAALEENYMHHPDDACFWADLLPVGDK